MWQRRQHASIWAKNSALVKWSHLLPTVSRHWWSTQPSNTTDTGVRVADICDLLSIIGLKTSISRTKRILVLLALITGLPLFLNSSCTSIEVRLLAEHGPSPNYMILWAIVGG